MSNLFWTPEHDAELRGLVADKYSASRAADAINLKFQTRLSRNAVCGRMHRLGMSTPRVVKQIVRRKREKATPKPHWIKTPKLEPNVTLLRLVEVAPRYADLLDLKPSDCRYPFGDGPFTFCGHTQLPGSSYCPEHFELSRRS